MITVGDYIHDTQPNCYQKLNRKRKLEVEQREYQEDMLTKFFLWLESWMDPLCEMMRK